MSGSVTAVSSSLRAMQLFNLLCLGVAIALIGGQAAAVDSPAPPELRVLTYNIHHGEGVDGQFDYRRLERIIRDLRPDLVALQEVDRRTRRASGVDQAQRLGELTNMHHVFGQAMPYSGGQYGEAILSRFPIKDVQVHPLPFRPGQEPRAALAVTVDPGNGLPNVRFVGTHLCHQSDETRTEQAEQLTLVLKSAGRQSLILAGDLNARPGSKPIAALLDDGWIDAVAPKSRIDYVMYRRDDPWTVAEVTIVPEDVASDHRPILVVLRWSPPRD